MRWTYSIVANLPKPQTKPQRVVEELTAEITKLEAQLMSLTTTSEADKSALEASESELSSMILKFETAQKELVTISSKYEELQVMIAKGSDELSKAKQEVMSLQGVMDTLDEESKSQNEVRSKLEAELATAAKSLEDKNREISSLKERHRKELENVSYDYQKEIDALVGNSGFKEKYEELNVKHGELIKSQFESLASYTLELENVNKVSFLHIILLAVRR